MTTNRFVMAAALAVSLVGCSANPVDLTEPTRPSAARIAKLEKAFREDISPTDRVRVATELVRLGATNPVYRAFIVDEVDRALAAEDAAAQQWIEQQHKPQVFGPARVKHELASAQPNTAPLADTYQPAASARDAERAPDVTNLVPVVAVSMSAKEGDTELRDRLRRALEGRNVLLSAEAALGLAKLKDKESITRIEAAAERFDEGFLFASALVYYGDHSADAIAARLLKDDELLREMKDMARRRKYDPYYRR